MKPLKERDIIRAIQDFLDARRIPYLRIHPVKWASKKIASDTCVGNVYEHRFIRPRASQVGAPDLIIFPRDNPPRFLAVEVKGPSGRQTTEQKAWEEKINIVGGEYLIARDIDLIMRLFGGDE